MTTKLIYIGRGGAFIGVPARDLTDEDFEERSESWAELGIDEAVLLKSGLYKKAGQDTEYQSDKELGFGASKLLFDKEIGKTSTKKGKVKKEGE